MKIQIKINEDKRVKIVAVDFDRVIHSYDKKWNGGKIYGYVVPGAKEYMEKLYKNYKLIIYTARLSDDYDDVMMNDMEEWLKKHEIPYDGIMKKLNAIAFIDDRAVECNPLQDEDLSWENAYKKVLALDHVKD